jgi:hypothetical protein
MGIPLKSRIIVNSESFYALFFVLMFSAKSFGIDDGSPFYPLLFVCTMFLFLMKIATTEHSVFEYTWMLLILLLSFAVYIHTGEKGLLLCCAMMLGMKNVNTEKVFRYGMIVLGILFAVNVFLSVFGLKRELIYNTERTGLFSSFRHSLGYSHPNTLQLNCLVFSMLVLYLLGKKSIQTILRISIILLMWAFYIFLYSGSRTALAVNIFYFLFNLLLLYKKRIGMVWKVLIQMIYPICAGGTVLLAFYIPQNIFDGIVLHSGTVGVRLKVARYFFGQIPLTVFGSRITVSDQSMGFGIDMAYPYLFLELGVVVFVLFGILYISFIHFCLRKNMMPELSLTISIILTGILEPFLFNDKRVQFPAACGVRNIYEEGGTI